MCAVITSHPVGLQTWQRDRAELSRATCIQRVRQPEQQRKLRGGGYTAHVNAAHLRDPETADLGARSHWFLLYDGLEWGSDKGDWSRVSTTLGTK